MKRLVSLPWLLNPLAGGEGEVEEEEATSLDELFALRPDVLEYIPAPDEDELEEDEPGSRGKKKKKKKKFVEMEYDPEKDVVVYRKKRKRGGTGEWDDPWKS